MNCPKCGVPIDYRFCTDCPQCQSELTPTGSAGDCVSTSQRIETKGFKLSPLDHVANAVIVLMCSGLGSVLGAVMSYICSGAVYLMLFSSTGSSADCSRGTAFAMLSILFGGFLGGSGGTIFGYRNRPVCVPSAS